MNLDHERGDEGDGSDAMTGVTEGTGDGGDRGDADDGVAGVTWVTEEEEEKTREVLTGQSKIVEVLADLKSICISNFKEHLCFWNISDGDEMA